MGIVKNVGALAFRDYITDGVPSSGKKKVSKADVRRAFGLVEKFAQINAVSITTTAQPASPADGAVYILPSGKSGAQWASFAVGALALYETGLGWTEVTPIEGWQAFVADTQRRYEWKAGAWSWTDPLASTAVDTDSTFAADSDAKVPSQKAVKTALAEKAPLESPALTGTPTAPTADVETDDDQIASTAFVHLAAALAATAAIDAIVAGAPAALDTFAEFAAAINDDEDYAATITSALAAKAPLASPNFTGNPAAPTPSMLDNDTSIATTAYVQGLLKDLFASTPEFHGAVGDGTTDDKVALTNWINAVMASPSRRGFAGFKVYATSGALPKINVPGVRLIGSGPSASHNIGTIGQGTQIKAITNTGFVILEVAPDSGASSQWLDGIAIDGFAFDCNSRATKGLVTKSLRRCVLRVACFEATTVGWEIGCVATLGEGNSFTRNFIQYVGRQQSNNAPSMTLDGDANGNVCFNVFEGVDIIHHDAIGIIEINADNNLWLDVRISHTGSGSASYAIEWRGGADATHSCRAERFVQFSSTKPGIARGTSSYTVAAKGIYIDNLDVENNTPIPHEEAGATIIHPEWRTMGTTGQGASPTVVSQSGTLTSATVTVRWRRLRNRIEIQGTYSVTTNGTGAGAILVSLPWNSHAQNYAVANFKELSVVGKSGAGVINASASTVNFQFADGGYPGGDGYNVRFSGDYRPVAA
jgi:hypothetical protein